MKELKIIADGVFEQFPNENKVFVTSDGQAFLDEVHAKNHSKNNRTGKELKLETFLREDEKKADTSKKSEELINEINIATELEVVKAILEAEQAGKKRKTVLEAAEAKITELSNTK